MRRTYRMRRILSGVLLLFLLCPLFAGFVRAEESRYVSGAWENVALDIAAQQTFGASGEVTVTVKSQGTTPLGEDFYRAVADASCSVMPIPGPRPGPGPMPGPGPGPMPGAESSPGMAFLQNVEDFSYDAGATRMKGTFQVSFPGWYSIETVLTVNGHSYSASTQTEFRLGSSTPMTISAEKGEETVLSVASLLGWNGLSLTVGTPQKQETADSAKAEISQTSDSNHVVNSLKIKPIQAGNDLSVTVPVLYEGMGNFGSQRGSFQMLVKVNGSPSPVPPIPPIPPFPPLFLAIPLLIVFVFAAGLLLYSHMGAYLPGIFSVRCDCGGVPISREVAGPRGRSFTLYALLKRLLQDASKGNSVAEAIRSQRKQLSVKRYRIYLSSDESLKGYGFYKNNRFETLNYYEQVIYNDFRDTGLTVSVAFLPGDGAQQSSFSGAEKETTETIL